MAAGKNFKPTPEQARGYAAREIAKTNANAAVESAGLETLDHIAVAGMGVVKEVVDCAKNNPIVGVVVSAVVVDILAQMKVVRPQTALFLFGCIGTAFGVSVATEVADIWAVLNPFNTSAASSSAGAELIRPTATTLVEGSTGAGAPVTTPTVPVGALMEAGAAAA